MPGSAWKTTVHSLGSSMDRCRDQVDRLVGHHPDVVTKEIYKNANTKVEVSIKTKNSGADKDWNSLLRQKKSSSDIRAPASVTGRNQVKARSAEGAGLKNKARQPPRKFTNHVNRTPARDETDTANNRPPEFAFKSRTLRIFLQEMRSAIKNQDGAAEEILDDLEFVLANLGNSERALPPPSQTTAAIQNAADVKECCRKPKSSQPTESDIFQKSLLRSQLKRLAGENEEIKKQGLEMRQALQAKEEKMADMKLIISRLTANNNDMLAILSSKTDVDGTIQKLQADNERLSRLLEVQQLKNQELESQAVRDRQEMDRLHYVIRDLKDLLASNLQESRPPLNLSETILDFDLSSYPSSNRSAHEDHSTTTDSALGEGISESHPLSSEVQILSKPTNQPFACSTTKNPVAGLVNPPALGASAKSTIQTKPTSAKVAKRSKNSAAPSRSDALASSSTKMSSTLSSSVANVPVNASKPAMPEMTVATATSSAAATLAPVGDDTFKPAPLDLSETQDSGAVSPDLAQPSGNTARLVQKETVSEVARKFDGHVQSFLHRLRTDNKFHISISSDMNLAATDGLSTLKDLTDDDSSFSTETKHRRGFDSSLNLSDSASGPH